MGLNVPRPDMPSGAGGLSLRAVPGVHYRHDYRCNQAGETHGDKAECDNGGYLSNGEFGNRHAVSFRCVQSARVPTETGWMQLTRRAAFESPAFAFLAPPFRLTNTQIQQYYYSLPLYAIRCRIVVDEFILNGGRMKTLREWRLARLYGVRDLAKQSGVSTKTIVQVEHGRQLPRLQTIRRLSEALDVEPTEVEEFKQALDVLSKDPALIDPGRGGNPVAAATATGPRAF